MRELVLCSPTPDALAAWGDYYLYTDLVDDTYLGGDGVARAEAVGGDAYLVGVFDGINHDTAGDSFRGSDRVAANGCLDISNGADPMCIYTTAAERYMGDIALGINTTLASKLGRHAEQSVFPTSLALAQVFFSPGIKKPYAVGVQSGNARLWHIRDNEIIAVTKDQDCQPGDLDKAGYEAALRVGLTVPKLTAVPGHKPKIFVTRFAVEPHDRILATSAGVHERLSEEELLAAVEHVPSRRVGGMFRLGGRVLEAAKTDHVISGIAAAVMYLETPENFRR